MPPRIWIQYHNTSKLKHSPTGESIFTKKRVSVEEDDIVLLLEGSNEPRQYQLWSWSLVDRIEPTDEGFDVLTKKTSLVGRPLYGDDFETFKFHFGKFGFGFSEITQNPFCRQLLKDCGLLDTRPVRHPLLDGCPPKWASGWGQDRYGIFAEFDIEQEAGKSLSQRMRWIPSGDFWMGSPDDEPERFDREMRHHVTLRDSFWIFDTPCTQELWETTMGENPSRFIDPKRPVEQISWEDVQPFLKKLNQIVSGLKLSLPTEAQWEYACRAGTLDATYAGPMEIVGANNAPILDDIAWYGGNSGHEFDLENGVASSSWPEKRFHHTHAGTRKVGQKQPNQWGLFDMLGNVWEWCQDWYGEYGEEPTIDSTGPKEGRHRVLRGGSWLRYAQSVRSAYRSNGFPDLRSHNIGFRCAQVHTE